MASATRNARPYLPTPADPAPDALLTSLAGAADVLARAEPRSLIGRIPAPDAHLCAFRSMTREQRSAAGRKGGLVRKLGAEERERRLAALAATAAKRKARDLRNAEVLRLRAEGLSGGLIALRMGLSRRTVRSVIDRSGLTFEAPSEKLATSHAKNAMAYYDLSPEEFHDYGIIRAKGFSQAEAADIILRSRRSAPAQAQES